VLLAAAIPASGDALNGNWRCISRWKEQEFVFALAVKGSGANRQLLVSESEWDAIPNAPAKAVADVKIVAEMYQGKNPDRTIFADFTQSFSSIRAEGVWRIDLLWYGIDQKVGFNSEYYPLPGRKAQVYTSGMCKNVSTQS
jgi:hypothetical protein